jgi:hypothetical protein
MASPITADHLRRVHQRQHRRTTRREHRAARAERVIAAMRDSGLTLLRTYARGHAVWGLSDGTEVAYENALDVRADPRVVGVGDSLFGTSCRKATATSRTNEPARAATNLFAAPAPYGRIATGYVSCAGS